MKFTLKIEKEDLEFSTKTDGDGKLTLTVDGKSTGVDIAKGQGFFSVLINNRPVYASVFKRKNHYYFYINGEEYPISLFSERELRVAKGADVDSDENVVLAVMPGKVVKLLKKEGDDITEGEGVLIVEAMKMENLIQSPRSGRVAKFFVGPADAVDTGEKLFELA